MAVRMFEKAVLNIKEVHDVGLFGAMIDSRLFALFGSSPFYFVMLPFVGLLLLVLATIQGYHLFKASNKHIDQWLGFLSLSVGAACANVSLTGAVIAKILGVSFLAGPWVFLGGMILACLHQSVMLGLNIYRVFE